MGNWLHVEEETEREVMEHEIEMDKEQMEEDIRGARPESPIHENSFFFKESKKKMIEALIRPQRSRYKASDLGPRNFRIGKDEHERVDFDLTNSRGLKLRCSHYRRVEQERGPCVIYLHGNAGSRVDSVVHVESLLTASISVLALDFSGSGKSEGKFVSLGFYERDDLRTVLEHATYKMPFISKIGLWGHSMGAATALMFADMDKSVDCLILDSSFSNLKKLCKEIVYREVQKTKSLHRVPKFVLNRVMKVAMKDVQKKTGMVIDRLNPLEHCKRFDVPALFLHASEDELVHRYHVDEMYAAYGGWPKKLIFFKGTHDSPRPEYINDSCVRFMLNHLYPSVRATYTNDTNRPSADDGIGELKSPLWCESMSKERNVRSQNNKALKSAIQKSLGWSIKRSTKRGGDEKEKNTTRWSIGIMGRTFAATQHDTPCDLCKASSTSHSRQCVSCTKTYCVDCKKHHMHKLQSKKWICIECVGKPSAKESEKNHRTSHLWDGYNKTRQRVDKLYTSLYKCIREYLERRHETFDDDGARSNHWIIDGESIVREAIRANIAESNERAVQICNQLLEAGYIASTSKDNCSTFEATASALYSFSNDHLVEGEGQSISSVRLGLRLYRHATNPIS